MLATFDTVQLQATRAWQSDEKSLLNYVVDLDVSAAGDIYVADPVLLQILVFNAQGTEVRRIGRKGAGPGEFQGIGSLQIGAKDTLYAFDNVLRRFTAFAPGHDLAVYSRTVHDLALGAPGRVYRTRSAPLTLATFSPPFRAEVSDDQQKGRQTVVRLLDSLGAIERDSLFVGIGTSTLFKRTGSMISVGTNVFGRQPLLRLSNTDHLFFSRSDSGVVEVIGLDGSRARRCAFRTPAVATTPQDLEKQQKLTSKRLKDVVADSMPAAWPMLGAMVVDNHNGVWFGLTGAGGSIGRWVWCDADGAFRGSLTLPPNVSLAAIRDSVLYAISRDDNDVPSILVLHLKKPFPTSTKNAVK